MSLTLTHVIPALDSGDHSFHLSQLVAEGLQAGIPARIVTLNPIYFRHRRLLDLDVPITVQPIRGTYDLPGLWGLVNDLNGSQLLQSWGAATTIIGRLRRLGLLTPHWIISQLPGDQIPGTLVDPLVLEFRLQLMDLEEPCTTLSPGVDGLRQITSAYSVPSVQHQHRGNLRKQLGLTANCRLVGTAGALTTDDQLKDVIWAADLLKVVRDDVQLIIFGDGPERWRWERFRDSVQINDRVHFVTPSPDICHELAELDCYWDVGRGPRLGWGTLCAAAHGVPIVLSTHGERQRISQSLRATVPDDSAVHSNAASTCLIQVGDRAQLARATMRILDDIVFATGWAETTQRLLAAGTHSGTKPMHALKLLVQEYARKK